MIQAIRSACFVLTYVLFISVASGQTVYVDDDANTDGNGLSWGTAFRYLQDAIDYAITDGSVQEIRIAQGIYTPDLDESGTRTPGDRNAAFRLINGVRFRGGYGGIATPDGDVRNIEMYATILSGDLADNDSTGTGTGENSINVFYHPQGLGLDLTAVIDGCTITAGNANGSYPDNYGGGIYNNSNSPTILNCNFVGNSAFSGGAICNRGNSNPVIVNCLFRDNSASSQGGAIWSYDGSPSIINCNIVNNTSGYQGGGLWNSRNDAIIANCIIWGNSGSVSPQIHNYNVDDTEVTYSCVQNGFEGEGNISENPMIISLQNMRLQMESPCIDSGNSFLLPVDTSDMDNDGNTNEPIPLDLGFNPRTMDSPTTADTGTGDEYIVDMGVYEFATDCNSNGVSDHFDVISGTSVDCNSNHLPDECEPGGLTDCDSNGMSDLCELFAGSSLDCNTNGIPDSCEDLTIIYVDDSAASDGDGTSWETAYQSLPQALQAAHCFSVTYEVRVAQGVYHPGDSRNDSFQLMNGVVIAGGYRGLSGGDDPNDRDFVEFETILSGDLNGNDISTNGPDFDNNGDNSCHVIYNPPQSQLDNTAILDGFTISGGNATAPDCTAHGGGMITHLGSPTVTNCNFRGNAASTGGGGLYHGDGTTPVLNNCSFINNWSGDGGGGGMQVQNTVRLTMTDCVFSGNTSAGNGAALLVEGSNSRLIATDCVFINNSTGENGGGLYGQAVANLTRCTFEGNSSEGSGGGMFAAGSNTNINECEFSNNHATADGGGLYGSTTASISSSSFSGNNADGYGGGVYGSSETNLIKCTLQENTSQYSGGGIFANNVNTGITECVFSSNHAENNGGGLLAATGGRFMRNIFKSNSANGNGGGVFANTGLICNCIFSGNESGSEGGGLYSNTTNLLAVNCTVIGNKADTLGGGLRFAEVGGTAENCIILDNSAPADSDVSLTGGGQLSHCCILNGSEEDWFGVGCIDANPEFVLHGHWNDDGTPSNPGDDYWIHGDYHLLPTSPCINRGNNEAIPSEVVSDQEGDLRIQNCVVDMGADESPFFQDDCNSNGIPDACDILAETSNDCNGNNIPDECDIIPDVIHVDDDVPVSGNGSDWSQAYASLSDALDLASSCPALVSEIHVAQGVYYPETRLNPEMQRTETFALVNGISLLGGFQGASGDSDPDNRNPEEFVTILSGDLDKNDETMEFPDYANNNDNANHVVTGNGSDESTIIDGFTITGGNADIWSVGREGGGLYVYEGNPTISNCVFKGNQATWGGGAGVVFGTPDISNCVFSGNYASSSGGGLYNSSDSLPPIVNCVFAENESYSGGGISSMGNTIMVNCLLNGNTANFVGGGIRSYGEPTTVINCTFSENVAGEAGGGLYTQHNGIAKVSNSVFWNNAAYDGPQLAASSWNYTYPSELVVTSSNIPGGIEGVFHTSDCTVTWATGNLDEDPLFLNAAGPDDIPGTLDDNLRLSGESPCINKGLRNELPAGIHTDLDENPRANACLVDLGAYENQEAVLFADADENCLIDLTDYEAFQVCLEESGIGSGTITDECSRVFDSDGDEDVDLADFAEFQSVFSKVFDR